MMPNRINRSEARLLADEEFSPLRRTGRLA